MRRNKYEEKKRMRKENTIEAKEGARRIIIFHRQNLLRVLYLLVNTAVNTFKINTWAVPGISNLGMNL